MSKSNFYPMPKLSSTKTINTMSDLLDVYGQCDMRVGGWLTGSKFAIYKLPKTGVVPTLVVSPAMFSLLTESKGLEVDRICDAIQVREHKKRP